MEKVELVLAVYPNARGFSFALFEGPDFVVDWGIREVARSLRRECSLKCVGQLLNKYRPDILVLRGMPGGLNAGLAQEFIGLSRRQGIPAMVISRKEMRRVFASLGKATREAIASEIVQRLPVFAPFRPGRRKIWNGEDRRMGLFDAAALAFALFASRTGRQT